jgi:methyl-accepting chemotaxis protein
MTRTVLRPVVRRPFHSLARPLRRGACPLILAALATAAPAVHAQPATGGARAPATSTDALSAQDHEVLLAAEQLATDGAQVIEQWILNQAVTEDQVFARLYFPLPKTDPQKFTTPYDRHTAELVAPEDRALARAATLQYAIVTDINGYIPAHNTRFAQPLTGDVKQDYANNRTKRMLGDVASILAARSTAPFLVQRIKLETGDVIYDLSVPVMVRGKHWGCARIGYRRAE